MHGPRLDLVLEPAPEIGLDHRLVLHDGVGRALGQNLALGHHDHRIAEPADEIHVVLDHAEGIAALLVQPHDGVADGVQKRAVHAGADLVEEDDLRLDHHRAAKFQEFLLATREVPGALVLQVRNRQEIKNLVGLLQKRRLFLGDPATLEPGVPQRLAGLTARNHHQVLAHRHRREFMRDLEGAQQPLVEQFVRRQAGDVLAIHRHGAGGGLVHPGDDVEQRGFSRPVRADQPGDGARRDL
ncbi:hypothetical protein SDC9_19491 [bioreactor metagenome]|uniref:Uncharacterized protein n=1 Tax=bioreactor metagenome TaxID=1076179 RepID=A0A644U439_9ZZZZ